MLPWSCAQCLKTIWCACLSTTDVTTLPVLLCRGTVLLCKLNCILLYIFCHTEFWNTGFTLLQQKLGSTGHKVARLHPTPNPLLPFAPSVKLPRPSWRQTVFRTSLEMAGRYIKSLNFRKVLRWMSWRRNRTMILGFTVVRSGLS